MSVEKNRDLREVEVGADEKKTSEWKTLTEDELIKRILRTDFGPDLY